VQANFTGKREIYLEVAEKYESYIKLGILSPGEKLPSVRAAAQEMGINPNTMARAYSYLEERGLIYTLPKKGVYVSSPEEGNENEAILKKDAREILISFKEKGLSRAALATLIEEVYGK
jgi:GntR family transcriptional regulator